MTSMTDIARILEKIKKGGGYARVEKSGTGGYDLYVDRYNPFDGKIEADHQYATHRSKKEIYERLIEIRFVKQYTPYSGEKPEVDHMKALEKTNQQKSAWEERYRKSIETARAVRGNRRRGLRGNPSHSDLIDGAVDVIINTRDFCGNEKQAVRDYCFENKVSDCKELYRMAMARANSKWNAYRQEAGVKCVRKNQMRSSFDKPVFGPGQAEYKRIDTTTGAGMRLEQKMRRAGWYQAQVTPFSTVLYRKKRR